MGYINKIIAFQIYCVIFCYQKLQLYSHEFDYTMIEEDIDDDWVSVLGLIKAISCHDSRKFGPHGGYNGVDIYRQYTLPPHWSLSISFELYYIWDWETTKDVTVKINDDDVIFQKNYSRNNVYNNKHNCEGSASTDSNFDFAVPYGSNFTHIDTEITLRFEAPLDGNIVGEALAISNLAIYIDTCYYTCKTCAGPDFNECITCPENAIFLQGECLCNNGYVTEGYLCVVNGACGFRKTLYEEKRVCVDECLMPNCKTCPNTYEEICTECHTGYKLQDNRCFDECPFFSLDTGSVCIDNFFETTERPYTVAADWNSRYFGHGEVYSSGWRYTQNQNQNILGQNINVSSYSTMQCNQQSLAVGFSFLPNGNCNGGCAIENSWDDLPPHFQYKLRVQLWLGDNWTGELFQIFVDGNEVFSENYVLTDTTPNRDIVCGNDFYRQDTVKEIDLAAAGHQTDSISVSIRWTGGNTEQQWLGLRNFSLILVQCENSNCQSCIGPGFQCQACKGDPNQVFSRTLAQNCACPLGYQNIVTEWNCQQIICEGTPEEEYSRDPYDSCNCPDTYYDARPNEIECQKCKFPCANCEGNSITCLTCINGDNRYEPPSCQCREGFFQNIRNICQACSAGCKVCTSADECTEEVSSSSFWSKYWYLIGLGVIFVILLVFLGYKFYDYSDKKNIKVININDETEQEKIRMEEEKQNRLNAQEELDRLRKKPRNKTNMDFAKASWSFKNVAMVEDDVPEINSARSNRSKRRFQTTNGLNDTASVHSNDSGKRNRGTVQNNQLNTLTEVMSRASSRQQSQRFVGERDTASRNTYRHTTQTNINQGGRSKFSRYNLN